jgi:hypothetical protein
LRLLVLTLGGHVGPTVVVPCTIVERSRHALAGVLGERAVLQLLRREEARLTRAYLSAMSARSPARVHDAMEVALREQLAHDAWLDEAAHRMHAKRARGA